MARREDVSYQQINNRDVEETVSSTQPDDEKDKRNHRNLPSSDILDDWWLQELCSAIASFAALVCLFLLLRIYDNQPQPTWVIPLNTVVSFLVLVAKACIFVLLSSSVGQLKWVWFSKKPQKLYDIQTFDGASRGDLLQCGKLLVAQKFRHLGSIGCVVFLIALGFGPFAQTAVHYYAKGVPDPSHVARLSNSTVYSATGLIKHLTHSNAPNTMITNDASVDSTMMANVYSSIMSNDPTTAWAVPRYTCSSGNCTWNSTASLGVRPRCANLTSMIRTVCDEQYGECTSSILNGPSLSYSEFETGDFIVINVTNTINGSYYNANTLPVIQYIMAQRVQPRMHGYERLVTKHSSLVATECVLDICVQSYKGSVSEGTYQDTDVDWWCPTGPVESNNTYANFQPPWHLSREVRTGQRFSLSVDSWHGMKTFLQGLFNNGLDFRNVLGEIWSSPSQPASKYASADTVRSILYGNYAHCPGIDDHLTCVANNVAKAMSKTLRDGNYIANGMENADMTIGDTMVATTFVRIEWIWLTLPGLVWILSLGLWIMPLWQTRRLKLQLWRNNPLPLLYLLGDSQAKAKEYLLGTSNHAHVEAAKRFEAQLVVDSDEVSCHDQRR